MEGCDMTYRGSLKQHFNIHHEEINDDEFENYKYNRISKPLLVNSIRCYICEKPMTKIKYTRHLKNVHGIEKGSEEFKKAKYNPKAVKRSDESLKEQCNSARKIYFDRNTKRIGKSRSSEYDSVIA